METLSLLSAKMKSWGYNNYYIQSVAAQADHLIKNEDVYAFIVGTGVKCNLAVIAYQSGILIVEPDHQPEPEVINMSYMELQSAFVLEKDERKSLFLGFKSRKVTLRNLSYCPYTFLDRINISCSHRIPDNPFLRAS